MFWIISISLKKCGIKYEEESGVDDPMKCVKEEKIMKNSASDS